jgi:hypothetical protein
MQVLEYICNLETSMNLFAGNFSRHSENRKKHVKYRGGELCKLEKHLKS